MTEGRKSLGELVDVVSGQVDPRIHPYSSLPHVGSDNIERDSGSLKALRTAAELGLTSGKYEFAEGDLLYSKIRPYLNKVASVGFRGICSADIYPLRVRESLVVSGYLVYVLRSKQFLAYAEKCSTRTSIPKINRRDFLAFEFVLPSLEEQKRIAAILDKADAVRRKGQEAIRLSDEFLRSAFLEMFGDPVTNPKRWPVETVGAVLAEKPKIGTIRPAGERGGQLVVRVGQIGTPEVALESCAWVTLDPTELERFQVRTGDLLLARAIGSESHLGKLSIFQGSSTPVVFDSHVMRLRADESRLNSEFLGAWLNSNGGRWRFMRRAGRTAVQFNINATQLSAIDIPIPPVDIQHDFRKLAQRTRESSTRLDSALAMLDELFASAVQRAFRGDLMKA